jgi:hypothetical protein
VWDRFSGRRDGTLWYYRAVLDILLDGRPNRLVGELERAVIELEREASNTIGDAFSRLDRLRAD